MPYDLIVLGRWKRGGDRGGGDVVRLLYALGLVRDLRSQVITLDQTGTEHRAAAGKGGGFLCCLGPALAALPLADGVLDQGSYLGVGDIVHSVEGLLAHANERVPAHFGGQEDVSPGQVWPFP